MKLKTTKSHTVEVTFEEIFVLLSRLVEKKSGKKIVKVDDEKYRGHVLTFTLMDEDEETNLDEPKA